MKQFTIIIPTMWFHTEQLIEMLAIYNAIPQVGEILIIDNDTTKTPDLNFKKVRLFGSGSNMYVNPSWREGAKQAKFDNIVLVNDDITLIGDIASLFEKVSFILCEKMIIGPDVVCYDKEEPKKLMLYRKPGSYNSKFSHGYGVFMFLKKGTILNTPIPEAIKVWYGDLILYYKNQAWFFAGLKIKTEMRGTTSKINLSGFAAKEKRAFAKYIKEKRAFAKYIRYFPR